MPTLWKRGHPHDWVLTEWVEGIEIVGGTAGDCYDEKRWRLLLTLAESLMFV